jgi:translation initiation factor eIF-2B subunit alpha
MTEQENHKGGVENLHVSNFRRFHAESASPAVSAIRVLGEATKSSAAKTMMGLADELQHITKVLSQTFPRHKVSVRAGSELFQKFVTRVVLDIKDFDKCKALLIQRGESFMDLALRARDTSSAEAQKLVKDGSTVLVHGYSRAGLATLRKAAEAQRKFQCVVTESHPDCAGYEVARVLASWGVPCTIVRDSAVAYAMDGIDFVLSGAENVTESGGIMSKIGTFQVSLIAKAFGKPFYVVAESFKFVREYPLSQREVRNTIRGDDGPEATEDMRARLGEGTEEGAVSFDNPTLDYTPPQNITLLCTDLGVFAPSRVSDELIKLYA